MSMTIPFRKVTIPPTLISRIESAVETGSMEASAALESSVAQAVDMPYALSTSSSTAALHLAMCALDLKRGDKVLCPINAFVDLPEVVRHFDAEPVFVDVLPGSYAIDPDKLDEAARNIQGKKLRAVIVNHPAGRPAPMEAIRRVADTYNLKVIEDATEMMGSPHIGRYSDMAVLGFGSKIDNTIDGGVLLMHDEEYYRRGKLLRNHGMVYTSDETRYLYDVLDIGCQYRMSEFAAVYCQELFAHNAETVARRREIAERYYAALGSLNNITLPERSDDHLYTQFIVTVGTNRDTFARKLREQGVEVSVQYIPLNFTQYYKEKYALKVFDFPAALDGYQKMMSLPIYADMRDDEVAYVCDAVRTIAKSHR
jgi:dTDP-4-amino-4,6-dideoxygalactose transaminase